MSAIVLKFPKFSGEEHGDVSCPGFYDYEQPDGWWLVDICVPAAKLSVYEAAALILKSGGRDYEIETAYGDQVAIGAVVSPEVMRQLHAMVA
jgi:hypothetical protein